MSARGWILTGLGAFALGVLQVATTAAALGIGV
jgi:hypothetical protein